MDLFDEDAPSKPLILAEPEDYGDSSQRSQGKKKKKKKAKKKNPTNLPSSKQYFEDNVEHQEDSQLSQEVERLSKTLAKAEASNTDFNNDFPTGLNQSIISESSAYTDTLQNLGSSSDSGSDYSSGSDST